MGAGALEAPTTKLRDYPVLDLLKLEKGDRSKLVKVAEAVWNMEAPIDWASDNWQPGSALQALDKFILASAKRNIALSTMYGDIRATCLARIAVAEDKKRKTKKRESESIGSVADSIVKAVSPFIQSKNFPNDFVNGSKLDLPLNFDRKSLKDIHFSFLLDTCDIEVRTQTGKIAYQGSHPKPVAEGIVRALLWGRSQFSVSSDRKAMDDAINNFLEWVSKTEGEIEKAIRESAYGTGYEDDLKKEVYSRLGIHPLSGAKTLPVQIYL
jgi:hypothetical protein